MKIPPSRIESVKVSLLNPHRWCCQLDCGHDEWVTAKRRPTHLTLVCSRCVEIAKDIK